MNRIAFAVKSALGLVMLAPPMLVHAAAAPDTALEEIVVTGIRKSVEESLEAKRAATDVVEVITAEDIGKMPDKNVADSLARVPGVTTSSASANEGGFDENDRVSMRGTNPSLTQTLVNGHGIAAGDWFVLNQVQQVGRSVSYTLLPSELVSQIRVQKSSSASLVEGGVAGSVDIITRKPLDFSKPFTLEASAGAVYADLPKKTDGQFSALGNFKNDANNFGVMLQLFSETRHLRRDGIEVLGYEQIAAGSDVALAHPDLAGVYYPKDIGVALFEQKRERKGGLFDIEFKPTDDLTLDLSAFYSKLTATNYNRNYLEWLTHFVNQGHNVIDPTTGLTTLVAQAPNPGLGSGAGYALHGIGSGPSFNLGSTNNTTPTPGGVPVTFGWIFGAQNVDVQDKETWAKIDSAFKMDNESWTDLKFGVRYAKHDRTSDNAIAQGPTFSGPNGGGVSTANYPTTFSNYPSNFNTFGASVPTNVWFWTPAQLAAYNGPGLVQRDLLAREYYQYLFQVHEKDTAAYVQADFKGSNWAGNIGVRFVHTQEDVVTYTQVAANTPGAITTSLFGPFIGIPVSHSYNDVLPSANLKIDVTPDLVARFAASQTMTRADYSALAGFTDLSPPANVGGVGSGSGGNPDLKPIRSTNLDAGLEWYFAKRSLLSATLFYMDLRNYVGFGSTTKSYLTYSSAVPTGAQVPYLLTVPVNAKGRVDGVEFAYQQAFTDNLGIAANYTYADGKQTSLVTNGDNRLVGTSKNTYNVSAYFENKSFNARVSYTYRSAFFSGLDRNTAFSQDKIGGLSASLGYTITDNFSITLDGQNLNNPTLKYYALNEDQPRAFYKNGAQYYLNFRFKL
jgi:iron complex outermembrane receptor protein